MSACLCHFCLPSCSTTVRTRPEGEKNPIMFNYRSTLMTIALMVASASAASAQVTPGTKVGVLKCQLSPSIGFIIGSHQQLACRFDPDGPFPPEAYVGAINTVGLDIGVTAGGALAWAVLAPTTGPMRGALAGV